MRTYEEMIKFPTFLERLDYLSLKDEQHTSPRSVSMSFYKSQAWKQVRKEAINRDLGFDLGPLVNKGSDLLSSGVGIHGSILVHHINPISEEDISRGDPKCLDLNNLVTTSIDTHNRIHYGDKIDTEYVERKSGDTKLW